MANDHKQVRSCGCRQPALRATLCRMPKVDVAMHLVIANLPFSFSETKQAILRGVNLWSAVVNLSFRFVDSLDDAHIVFNFTRIDRPGRILADMEFPCPWRGHVNGRFDSSETWGESAPPLGSQISLPTTAAHEVGHALGIGHGGEGVMNWQIRSDVNELGDWDKQQALLRYDSPAPNGNGGSDMNGLFGCLIAALPQFFTCMLSQQEKAEKENKEGPVDAVAKLFNAWADRR